MSWLTQKANKAPARDLLCSRTPQATSRIAKVPHLRHLLEWVLEAQANKWLQGTPVLQIILA